MQWLKNSIDKDKPYRHVGPFIFRNNSYFINKLVPVEPMSTPTGLVFTLKKLYNKSKKKK